MGKMAFTSDSLLQQLQHDGNVPCYQVAYSGGLDSHVLLHAMCAVREQLGVAIVAVHVNHGLQAEADQWQVHCQQVCAALKVDFTVLPVDARAQRGESPEAAARAARYQALADWLPAQHCLLTAQHQDDQAETLLLQLLRGSGVSGLAAMPAVSELGAGSHRRPLLGVSRAALQQYATQHALTWVEDPSNNDTAYDRNFLRHAVMPVLRERWPAVSTSLSRSAAHCAEASEVLAQLAAIDLLSVHGTQDGTLSVSGLGELPGARQINVLRAWLKQHTGHAPATAVLARLITDVLDSRVDAEPRVSWNRFDVRRYRDDVFCLPQGSNPDPASELHWSLSDPLTLPGTGGVLTATAVHGTGLRRAAVTATGVRVSWRKGGERCLPVGRVHHHSLKKLFQAQGIPPWERDRIPLIFVDDELALVPGLWVCEPFQAGPAEPGVVIHWQHD